MTDPTDKGLIDAVDRVLSQLLQSVAVKNGIRITLNNLDPAAARRLVRTILWQDAEFGLSLMAAAPALGNALIYLVDELTDQINDKYPPEMLADYLETVLSEIDRDALDRARQKAAAMITSLTPVIEKTLLDPGGAAAAGQRTSVTVSGQVEAAASPVSEEPAEPSDPEEGGSADAPAGVLAEILRTAFVKDILREMLTAVDPEKGTAAARALLWEDMETGFAVLGALPPVINFYLNLVSELGLQLSDKIPPRLFMDFMAGVFEEIDGQALRRGLRAWQELGQRLIQEGDIDPAAVAHDWLTRPATTQTVAAGLNQGLAWINRLEQSQPGTLRACLAGVAAGTDRDELNRAVRHLAEAVLDQRPPFFALAWRSVKLYLLSWFRRTP